jgi:hypothetical protein
MKREARKKTKDPTAVPKSLDSNAAIGRRAYDIWVNEGGSHGRDLDHWLQAERELAFQQTRSQLAERS